MKLPKEKNKQITLWIIEIATACILIFLAVNNVDVILSVLNKCAQVISPLLIGFIIALILNVPMKYVESHLWTKTNKKFLQKTRRPIAFIISLVIILGIIIGIFCLIIPELIAASKVIVQGAINLLDKLQDTENIKIFGFSLDDLLKNTNWDNMLSKLQEWLKEKSGTIVDTAFSTAFSVIGGVVDFFIAFVFSIYILFSKETLKKQAKRIINAWIPQKIGNAFLHISSVANKNFRNFISGQTLEAIILGTLCLLGMIILRIPYAPMVSALVCITALVPVVGGLIGAGVGAFMILTVSPMKALIFIVYLIILQQLEGNVIYPKVMGSKVNLPAIWILAAVTVGGAVGGIFGMFLSVPVTSTAYMILKEETVKREVKKEVLLKKAEEDNQTDAEHPLQTDPNPDSENKDENQE